MFSHQWSAKDGRAHKIPQKQVDKKSISNLSYEVSIIENKKKKEKS